MKATFLTILAALALLFSPVLLHLENIMFSNDAPLGVVMADARGKAWRDGNWFGFSCGSDMETVAGFMRTHPLFCLVAAIAVLLVVTIKPKMETICRCYGAFGFGICLMIIPAFFVPHWLPAVVNTSIGLAILYFFGYILLDIACNPPPDLKCPPTHPVACCEVVASFVVVVIVALSLAGLATAIAG